MNMYEGKDKYHYALSSNQAWAGYKSHQNPSFFRDQAAEEKASILWLGCSDSRLPETTILGMPTEIHSHRTLASIITPTDLSTLATLEHAVTHLSVSHVVLCGHTSCTGAALALSGSSAGGVLDAWLSPLRVIAERHSEELRGIKDERSRAARVAELSVQEGVRVIMSNWAVREAVRERGLEVHGCMYDVATGRLRDLGLGTDGVLRGAGGGEEVVRGRHATLVFRDGGATMAVQ